MGGDPTRVWVPGGGDHRAAWKLVTTVFDAKIYSLILPGPASSLSGITTFSSHFIITMSWFSCTQHQMALGCFHPASTLLQLHFIWPVAMPSMYQLFNSFNMTSHASNSWRYFLLGLLNIMPSVLVCSRGWRSLADYSPRGHKESDTTERLHFTSL